MKKIGERLRELRKSKNMKQGDMCRVLGISVPAYSKIETGVNEITLKHLFKLKTKFNISVEWLLFGLAEDDCREFYKNEDEVKSMPAAMKSSNTVLYSLLSHYYGIIGVINGQKKKLANLTL